MNVDNATPVPVDAVVSWAVRRKDERVWRKAAPAFGFDLFLHWYGGCWCAAPWFDSTGFSPCFDPVEYRGRILAFSVEAGGACALVLEDSRRLVVLPVTALRGEGPSCP